MTAVITVVLVRPDGGGNGTASEGSNGANSEFASAHDSRPVTIITEDPTCDAWNATTNKKVDAEKSIGWPDRDFKLPASSWTPEQRAMFESAGKSATQAADRAVNLAKTTPHRVMRILYEQYIAYSRAFVDRIPSYNGEEDDRLVSALNGAGDSLTYICAAITYHVAQAVSPLVPVGSAPSSVTAPEDPNAPTKLIGEPNSVCAEWTSLTSKFDSDTEAWRSINKNVAAKDWTPEQKATNDAAVPMMSSNAEEMERLGRQSGDPRFEDIATLGAQYRRGFAELMPEYKPADGYMVLVGSSATRLINAACKFAA